MESSKRLVDIPIRDIHPHPDNPRKELGDLTELANSIKASGIMQNLTVVPNIVIGEVSGQPWQRGYKVIIGHRRLAAAKLAGLESVPCAIVEMSELEQAAVMLAENMQRADLSLTEQAQGIQTLLDFGDTVARVAERTGLSETTIRRRTKLMELPKDKLRAAEARGATLQDYIELDKIKDPLRKDRVLDSIGTANFRAVLAREAEAERMEETREHCAKEIGKWAKEIQQASYVDGVYV